MVIKNLTSENQMIKVRDIVTRDEYTLILHPYGTTTRDKVAVVGGEKLEGIIEIGGYSQKDTSAPVIIEESISEDADIEMTPSAEDPMEEPQESLTEEILQDKFICEECGAEFGSARGLASHMNRVHSK